MQLLTNATILLLNSIGSLMLSRDILNYHKSITNYLYSMQVYFRLHRFDSCLRLTMNLVILKIVFSLLLTVNSETLTKVSKGKLADSGGWTL